MTDNPISDRPAPPTYDLGVIGPQSMASDIHTIRGLAIEAYAGLEHSLCHLLSLASGTTYDVAAVIFFKITSADARNQILKILIKKKFGTSGNLFWNSYFKELNQIDRRRNEIVHWSAITELGGPHSGGWRVVLQPGNSQTNTGANRVILTIDDLRAFIAKSDVYARLSNVFVNGHLFPEDWKGPWPEVFKQKFDYPPADDHPISTKFRAWLVQNQPPT
jgi:hypothetical protein